MVDKKVKANMYMHTHCNKVNFVYLGYSDFPYMYKYLRIKNCNILIILKNIISLN